MKHAVHSFLPMATSSRRLEALHAHLHPRAGFSVSLSPEVEAALASGRPVVALESTIISHGMPWPQNLETARRVEAVVRAHGAVPATVAVLAGVPTVGLTDDQLMTLARAGPACLKTSRRDLAFVVASKRDGATTVSATMLLAAAAGVSVFVTGGIGGVHRGGAASFDISADLVELGRTPVAVVCSGVKSILDIRATLEVLETHGVAVATLGSGSAFPAFYTRDSGFSAPHCVADAREAAAAVHASLSLGLVGGMLFAVPIPHHAEADAAAVEAATQAALREAEAAGVTGAAITPFLLRRVAEATGGASLRSNIELILNNAAVGADIAVELAALRRRAAERVGQ